MASTWTDSRNVSGTVATTSQTQLGNDINVPSNQTWRLFNIFGAHSIGGTYQMTVDSIPGGNFSWIQNTLNDNEIGDGLNGYPLNTTISGPAVIKLLVTNSAGTSGTGRAQLNYQVTARGGV